MKYAIINLAGKQYQVEEGQKLAINKLPEKNEGDEFTADEVLLYRTDKSIKVGKPVVSGVKVTLQLVKNQKGEKIHVRRFKAKSRYRRHIGHRQHESVLKVVKISA